MTDTDSDYGRVIPPGTRVFVYGCNGPNLGTVKDPAQDEMGNYFVLWDEEFEGGRDGQEALSYEAAELATKIEALIKEGKTLEEAHLAVISK